MDDGVAASSYELRQSALVGNLGMTRQLTTVQSVISGASPTKEHHLHAKSRVSKMELSQGTIIDDIETIKNGKFDDKLFDGYFETNP